jgi:hypothetical protein
VDPATVCGWVLAMLIAPVHLVATHLETSFDVTDPAAITPAFEADPSPVRRSALGPENRCSLPDPPPGSSGTHRRPRPAGRSALADIAPRHAVLDRVVDGVAATLLVGPDERELLLPADTLPGAATDGSWLILDTLGRVAALDEEFTEQRRQALHERLAAIRQRRSAGRFSR